MMEKLLNLLNEYESESWIIKDGDIVKIGCDDYGLPCIDSYKQCIISKSYGFIDWLVKNDKIDFGKFFKNQGDWIIDNIEDVNPIKDFEYYQLLMILSIQDNSIEYLCSILK